MTVIRYTAGDELEPLDITWPQPDGTPYDFSAGWSFTARIGVPDGAALVEKTTGFTGAAVFPNLQLAWADGDLDVLTAGSYHLDIKARLAAGSLDVTRTWLFQILPGVLAAPAP